MKNVEYKYFESGGNITLNCKSKVLYWSGPAVTNITPVDETTLVDIIDKYDKKKKWNILIYTKGNTIKKTLPPNLFKRLTLIGDNFDLLITNMSTSDEGLYICDPTNNTAPQKRYLLQNKCKYVRCI